MRLIVITFLLCFTLINVNSQRVGLQAKCCVTDEKIMVRWAPEDADSWREANKYGYTIERYTIMRGDSILPVEEIQRQKQTHTVQLSPVEAWEPYSDEQYVAIAAECIYGESPAIPAVSPAAIYGKYNERRHRHAFALYSADMSLVAARLSGLLFDDTDIRRDEKYLYKVFVNVPVEMQSDTAMTFANAKVITPLVNIPCPEAEGGNRIVHLSWEIGILGDGYTSYIVERSQDEHTGFVPITKSNIVAMSFDGNSTNYAMYTDSVLDNQTRYYYRVRGVDCFGRISEPSESIAGQGAMPFTTAPMIIGNTVDENRRIALNWQFPDSLNGSISGFKIYRQSSPQKRLRMIYEGHNPQERSFVDLLPDITNYYKMSAYNKEKELITPNYTYVELVDSFPPLPPQKVHGVIDTAGVATITWKANTERDLLGYRVYSNNRPDGEFALQTSAILHDTIFYQKVNLNTLTRRIYYQIRAVDVRDNISNPSATLTLIRPDTIPPVAPIFRKITTEKGVHNLEWIPSSSNDVVRHLVLRREPTMAKFDTIAIIDKIDVSTYTDKKAQTTLDYYYAIKAIDESGNSRESVTLLAHATEKIDLKLKIKLRNSFDLKTIEWSVAKTPKEIAYFLIYKEIEDNGFLPYDTSKDYKYEDKDAPMNQKCRYALKAKYVDEQESELILVE